MQFIVEVISNIASALMYWMTPVFIRKHRGGKTAVLLIILLTNIWCFTEIQIIRNWGINDYLIVAVGDTIMCVIIAMACYGNFFKNLIVFYAGCYFQQILFLVLISVSGSDKKMNDYFNGNDIKLSNALILTGGSLAAAVVTVMLFRSILLRWTDERSTAYRIIAAILMISNFTNGVLKREAAVSSGGAIAVIVISGLSISVMAVFLFVLYDKLQIRWIRRQHDALRQMVGTDEIIGKYSDRFERNGIRLFVNELSVKTEEYMAVAVMLLDETMKYALSSMCPKGRPNRSDAEEPDGKNRRKADRVVQVYVREYNDSIIWSVEMLTGSEIGDDGPKAGKKDKSRRAYLDLRYAVENQGGILDNERFAGGQCILAVVPMK